MNFQKSAKAIKKTKTTKALKFEANEIFNKFDKKKTEQFEVNGQTWYRFTGRNTTADLKPLLDIDYIKRLRLPADNLLGDDISLLGKMNLLALDLVGSSVNDATIKEISKFNSLEELSLRKTNYLKDNNVKHLVNLSNLKKLDLSCTNITDYSNHYLEKLEKLEEISFDSCKDFHGENIGKLKNLKVLDLVNSGFKPANLKELKELKFLKTLELAKLNLVDNDLIPLKKLKISKIGLDANNNLTDKSLKILEKIPTLKSVSMNEVERISKQAESTFRKNRSDCQLQVFKSGDTTLEGDHEIREKSVPSN